MSALFEKVTTVLLTLAAVGVASALVHREFIRPGEQASAGGRAFAAEQVERAEWDAVQREGIRVGSESASITIVEFSDFECPYCRRFDSTMRALPDEWQQQVARVLVHFPLDQHRFAVPAAIAAECAHEQGAFSPMERVLFAKQDSFGLKPWTSYAIEANIPDTATFASCMQRVPPHERIARGRALAESLAVRATPTLYVNGWRLSHSPRSNELMRLLEAARTGRPLDTVAKEAAQ